MPTAGEEQNPSIERPPAIPRHQLFRGAEVHGAVYAVCGAFTSLLTAVATRHAVRRAIEQALFAPAAATLATFNRNCRDSVTIADLGSSMAAVPPDPASFDCAPRFQRDMAVANRRMSGTVLARASSISGVRAAARRLSDGGASCDSERGGICSASGVEEDEGQEGPRASTDVVEDQAVALVSEVAEVRLFKHVGVFGLRNVQKNILAVIRMAALGIWRCRGNEQVAILGFGRCLCAPTWTGVSMVSCETVAIYIAVSRPVTARRLDNSSDAPLHVLLPTGVLGVSQGLA